MKLFEKFHFSLNNFKINSDKNYNYSDLLSLINSNINEKQNDINNKTNLIKDLLTNENKKSQKNNLIDGIIEERVNINKKSLNEEYNTNSYKLINKAKETFITKINDINKKYKKKEEEKIYTFGKSLNDCFIKSINDEMIKKGIILKNPLLKKSSFKKEIPLKNNYNNLDLHMKIFNQKIMKKFKMYINQYKESQKLKLRSISQQLADKKEKMTNLIPLYIKAYKKENKDVFHSKRIYDIKYQNRYEKPLINLDEILQYQNQCSDYNFRKGKIPFYQFLRTVNNPYENLKKNSKRPHSGIIHLKLYNKKSKQLL